MRRSLPQCRGGGRLKVVWWERGCRPVACERLTRARRYAGGVKDGSCHVAADAKDGVARRAVLVRR